MVMVMVMVKKLQFVKMCPVCCCVHCVVIRWSSISNCRHGALRRRKAKNTHSGAERSGASCWPLRAVPLRAVPLRSAVCVFLP